MGYKLLLADDSITIQKVVSIIFANEDYNLTVVDNGNDTLDKAREIIPDVILVDALMPGKSGYDVCMDVRKDQVLKNIPLLLLIGAFEPFDEEKAARSGADDHIAKPFESQALIDKVRKLVELGRERAAADTGDSLGEPAEIPDAAPVLSPEMMSVPGESGDAGRDSLDVLSIDSMEVVEVTAEDDLWGTFEVAEVAEEDDLHLGEIVEGDELQPEIIDTEEEIEPFVFTEEEQAFSGNDNTISLGEISEQKVDVSAEIEESFVFREEPEPVDFGEPASSGTTAVVAGSPASDISDDNETDMPISAGLRFFREAAASGAGSLVPPVVPEQPYVQESPESEFAPEEIRTVSRDIPSGEAEELAEEKPLSGSPGTINLSEEQLQTMLSRVSREIIEKIAWEVVPDLAESIIREEIRKIKEGL